MIVRWQVDLVNTKESVLTVCYKPYPTNKRKVHTGDEIEVLRNSAFFHTTATSWTSHTFISDA